MEGLGAEFGLSAARGGLDGFNESSPCGGPKFPGVRADGVRGVFPTVTYPSHTTIITGALPIRHGIYYNSPFEPDGETGRW